MKKLACLATLSLCSWLVACSGSSADTPEAPAGTPESDVSVALLVRLEAKPDKAEDLAAFLAGALPAVEAESGTHAWYGVRLSGTSFAIYDAFPSVAARDEHLAGQVAAALMQSAPDLLAAEPVIAPANVIAAKVESDPVSVGLIVQLEAQPGKEAAVEQFLEDALALVEEEPGTTQWFAVQIDEDSFAIYDAFPNEAARDAHLSGQVAAALMAHAPELLAAAPVIEPVDVLAAKLPH